MALYDLPLQTHPTDAMPPAPLLCSSMILAWGRRDLTPVHHAARYDRYRAVTVMLFACPEAATAVDRSELTPCHVAMTSASTSTVAPLLAVFPQAPRQQDINGTTPLYYASRSGRLDIVQLLAAADPDALPVRDADGWTCVHTATNLGRTEVLAFLLHAWPEGARAVGTTSWRTPFHIAAEKGNLPVLKILVSTDARGLLDANVKGETPIHLSLHAFTHRGVFAWMLEACPDDDLRAWVQRLDVAKKVDAPVLEALRERMDERLRDVIHW